MSETLNGPTDLSFGRILTYPKRRPHERGLEIVRSGGQPADQILHQPNRTGELGNDWRNPWLAITSARFR